MRVVCNVIDVEVGDELETQLEKTARALGKKHGFSHTEHHLDFTGVCSTCS